MDKKYFKLQLKSIFKSYPMILLVTLLTIFSIVLTCYVLMAGSDDSEKKKKLSVGIVGNLEGSYLEIGLHALENLDSSRFYFDFKTMDEESAVKALKKREISGFLLIPDGFVEDVYHGRNTPAEYVTLSSSKNFGDIVSREVTLIISDMLTNSQRGMYSMQDMATKYNNENRSKKIDELTYRYADIIFRRDNLYKVTHTGVADALSLGGYYVCGLIVFFLLLWGISCSKVFTSRKLAFSRLLKASGLKTYKQVLCEYLAYFTTAIITLLLFAVIAGGVLQFANVTIPELVGVTPFSAVMFVIAIIPVVVMITLMQSAFYEITSNPVGAILTQFILAIGLGYISGCLYPISFFPEIIQKISFCLPTGAGFSFVRKVMTGVFPATELFIILIYCAIFFGMNVVIRKYRMAGDAV